MNKKLVVLTIFLATIFDASSAFAATNSNIFVSGTDKLIKDALNWLLFLIPGTVAAAIAYQNWQKNSTEEPAEIAQKNKLIKKYLVSGVIGMCSVAVVRLILGYYSVTNINL